MIDLNWLDSMLLFAAVLGLVLWVPIHRWRKARRQRNARQGPQ
jgi:hypothetical protein